MNVFVRLFCAVWFVLGFVAEARADIILSAPILNAALRTMTRLQQQAAAEKGGARGEPVFRLAAEADKLASLINDEIASHGMQERELIDLAISRTTEMGIAIDYNREKKKFFYDGAAFREYLRIAPRGAHAAEAEFALLSYDFYQATGTDVPAILASAAAKQRFLARYPTFAGAAELSLYLAVDYRDLYRHYREANETANAAKYRQLTRAEYQRISRRYPDTEQAESARQLLRRFDEESKR